MQTQRGGQRRWLARYAFALAAVGAGFLLREALTRLAGGSLPTYITFYPAVMLAALLGGVGPGLLATVAAALVADYFILPPQGSFAVATLSDAVGLALFSGMGVFMSGVAELYRRARQRAAAQDTEVFLSESWEEPPTRSGQNWLLSAGLVASLAILAAAGWQSARNMRAVAVADQWETHTYVVIQELDRLLSILKDAETGQRGYLLTGEEKYLEPYQAALGLVQTNLVRLKQLTQDNPREQRLLVGLESLTQEKVAELKQTIELRRAQGLPAALTVVGTGKDKILMDQIRQRVAEAQAEEERLLQQQTRAKTTDAGRTLQALLAGAVLSFFLLVTVFLFLKQENTRRTKAEAEVRHHRDHVQEMVAARTEELGRANDQLKEEIEEHQQAKEALRQQREWLRVTLTSIGDAVLATDTAGRITFLNPVAESLTGWPENEALGQPVQTVFRLINEQTHAPGEDIVARVLREGQMVALANHIALLTRDGRAVPIEDSAAPIKDSSGTASGVVLVFHDVTQKRRAQEALRESEERLRFALETNHTGAWELDLRDQTAHRSLEHDRIFGYTEPLPQWTYEMFLEHVLPEDRLVVDSKFRRAAETGSDWSFECRIRRADQQTRWIWAAGQHRTDSTGVRWGMAGIVQDITERKQKEEELRRLNRLLQARSNSIQAVMRAKDESDCLEEVCRIVVEDCGHAMVWVGLAQEDDARTVRPVAHAGFEEGYLETLNISWADIERGRGPTGTAIRTGKPCLCRNMGTDPQFAPWRQEALKRGYASSLVLPLMTDGKAFGAMTIYSKQPDAFPEAEGQLLAELADNLAYGMTGLRLRAAKAHAEEALRKANEDLEHRVAARTSALRAAERYARSLLEASLDPLVTISHDGKITDVNLATELITAIPRDQLIGSSFSTYFTEPEQAEAGYQKVLKEGAVADYPLTVRHLSGDTTDVLYNATVYRNEAGEVQGVFAAARDITQRKEAERRRDFTNSLLSLFATKSSAKDYLGSVVEIIRQWSGCQALGIRLKNEQQEIPYESWAGFEPGFLELERCLSLERDNCLCIRAISGGFEEPDRPLLTPGGSFRADDAIGFASRLPPEKLACYRANCMKFGFASLAIVPIRYRGKIVGALHLADRRPGRFPLATVEFIESITPLIGEAVHRFQTEAELARHRDHLEELVKQRTSELVASNARLELEIAERKLAQERLQHAAADLQRSNRDLEQFAYVASHDLQEPLRAVGGYVTLLQRRFPEVVDAKAREYIAGAADGATRMERLITDLLAYSRVGSRGGAFLPNDLNALLKEVLHNLQPGIRNARATVSSDLLPTLAVDATQMRQLFQNLIANALKFRAERPPEIHVGAQQQEGRWVFSVRDNGIGIEPEFFERIFQIFQRLHTRKHYPGTGIGLAICKKIVERHGGVIWVESQPGQGSAFYFSIPKISDRGSVTV